MAKNDEMIKQLMSKVASQKEALGTRPKVSWKTNGIFKFEDGKHLNLNAAQIPALVESLAYLFNKSNNYDLAIKTLKVSVSEFQWSGYSVSEWIEDFQTRISVIQYEEKKQKLNETESKLSALVSEEARTEMELEKIAKSLL